MLSKIALLTLLPFALQAFAAPATLNLRGDKTSSSSNSDNGGSDGGNNSTHIDLNGGCAPGGNLDLSQFSLQLPVGQQYHPTTVSSSQLAGCQGYQQKQYFYTDTSDGAMVMKVPGSPDQTGCVTTQNSKHCRTELRENGSWDPNAATNRLTARLMVPTADDSEHGTVIGQVHIDDSVSSKPVAELFINKQGVLSVGVEQTRQGGNEKVTQVGSVQPGSTFQYDIVYQNNQLSVAINGGQPKTLSTYQLNAPKSYFKAGNYNQGQSASEVHFFKVQVQH